MRSGVGGARRWPLHPPPHPGEALTSWLARLAILFSLSPSQLLRHSLGPVSALMDDPAADDLDWDPPVPILEALAARTGTPTGELRLMTIGGRVPWLADTLDPEHGHEVFHTYVRQDSVLLRPGEAGTDVVGHWRPWFPPDHRHHRAVRRVCPVCASDPDRGIPPTAMIPLMLSCPEHGRRLENAGTVTLAAALDRPAPDRKASEPVLVMDHLTRQGLTTGTVTLPRRSVHVGIWFRLLRTLLDEVSISTSRVRRRSVAALEQIWDAAGCPPRVGLAVWRPHETLDLTRQEAMLEAAATALDLIQTGKITAHGSLGPPLRPQPHQHVYDGDQLSAAELARRAQHEAMRQRSAQAQQDIEAWFAAVRSDPSTARQIFGVLTHHSRTREAYERERDFTIRQASPAPSSPTRTLVVSPLPVVSVRGSLTETLQDRAAFDRDLRRRRLT